MDFEEGVAVEMSELLQSKIASVRRKLAMVKSSRGLAAAVGIVLLMLTIGMLLDFAFELPRGLRVAFLALDITALTFILLTYVLAPLIWGPDDDEIALMVERATPQFATRLIASVQLARPGAVPASASSSIVRAMIAQTEDLAEPMDFSEVVKSDDMLKMLAMTLLIVVFGLAAFVWGNSGGSHMSTDLLARAFLSERPIPRKTRINVPNGNKIIPLGDPITIEAFAQGIIPAHGEVDLEYKSGRKQTFTIDPMPDEKAPAPADGSTRFARLIDNVQESFSYRLRLNDAHTPWFTVQAQARPTVSGVDFTLKYPTYTHRAPEHKSPGDLTLLAGSELSIKISASKRVKEGQAQGQQVAGSAVRLVGLSEEIPLKWANSAHTELTATIPKLPTSKLNGLSFYLEDDYGIASRNETVYPVELVLDKDPVIRITYPDRKDELATAQARVLLAFEATDDFGIAKIILWHKLDTEENPAAQAIELDLSGLKGEELRRIQRRYEFNLLPLHVAEQAAIEYWLEVQDGNNVTGPGKAISEHYKVKVVSELEKRADLMNRLNDQLGTVDYVTQDQEKLNQSLGKLITEKK
jgi:hypothetical protein